jgi:hypothetical protein
LDAAQQQPRTRQQDDGHGNLNAEQHAAERKSRLQRQNPVLEGRRDVAACGMQRRRQRECQARNRGQRDALHQHEQIRINIERSRVPCDSRLEKLSFLHGMTSIPSGKTARRREVLDEQSAAWRGLGTNSIPRG